MKGDLFNFKFHSFARSFLECLSFLALHFGISADSRTQVRYALKSAKASGFLRTLGVWKIPTLKLLQS